MAWLAQPVEHQTFNLRVKGASPLSGEISFFNSFTLLHLTSICFILLVNQLNMAWLAQSVEHQTFNLRVKGSSPLSGDIFF